jgi:hypothetical protein
MFSGQAKILDDISTKHLVYRDLFCFGFSKKASIFFLEICFFFCTSKWGQISGDIKKIVVFPRRSN